VHIDDLCRRFGVTRRLIHRLVHRGLMDPPQKRGRYATYSPQSLADLKAYLALKHVNTSMSEVSDLLREDGISLAEYAEQRENAIRYHGLAGVA
jgi:DNA-binding transcriptional MerR regulator